MSTKTQFVTLGVASELFAVPVERVQEILQALPVTPLPHAPADFLGMIDVRGEGVPVFDLRTRLGLEPRDDTHNTRIIVLEVELAGARRRLGLRADRVFEVTGLDGDLEPPPDIGPRWNAEAVAGIGRRNGSFVTVFDIDRLFSLDSLVAGTRAAALVA